MDPERPIEKLLRQAAEARRVQAGAPQELHPANRRMLQSEIARKYAAGAAASKRRSFFDLFMLRFAWAAAVLVGVGLAASLMLPRQNGPQTEMFFAKNDRVAAPAASVPARPESTLRENLSSPAAKPIAPSEAPAPAKTDIAHSKKDKDISRFKQKRQSARRQPAVNESPAAPQAMGAAGT